VVQIKVCRVKKHGPQIRGDIYGTDMNCDKMQGPLSRTWCDSPT